MPQVALSIEQVADVGELSCEREEREWHGFLTQILRLVYIPSDWDQRGTKIEEGAHRDRAWGSSRCTAQV